MRQPKRVGIVLACYNLGKYIESSIKALESQSFNDFDLIICDDASTDRLTKHKIAQLSNKGYAVAREKKNLGLSRLVNKHAANLKNEYLVVYSADDVMKKDYLKTCVAYLDEHRGVAAVSTWLEYFGEQSGIRKYSAVGCNAPSMLVENGFCGSAVMRMSAWQEAGGYSTDLELSFCEDYDLWLNMLSRGMKLAVIPVPLLRYRVLSSSTSHSVSQAMVFTARKRLFTKYEVLYELHSKYVIEQLIKRAAYTNQTLIEITAGKEWLEKKFNEHNKIIAHQENTISSLEGRVSEAEFRLQRILTLPFVSQLARLYRFMHRLRRKN